MRRHLPYDLVRPFAAFGNTSAFFWRFWALFGKIAQRPAKCDRMVFHFHLISRGLTFFLRYFVTRMQYNDILLMMLLFCTLRCVLTSSAFKLHTSLNSFTFNGYNSNSSSLPSLSTHMLRLVDAGRTPEVAAICALWAKIGGPVFLASTASPIFNVAVGRTRRRGLDLGHYG